MSVLSATALTGTDPSVTSAVSGAAYGLRLSGLPSRGLLPAGELDWPLVRVAQAPVAAPRPERFDADGAQFTLLDGDHTLTLHRRVRRAVYHGPTLAGDDLVHPYLARTAVAFARWHGHQAFHAGAFLIDGGAWAVLGAREAGKSTLLAALAVRGVPILSDDIVITDGARAFAGPRSLDLRVKPDASRLGGELTVAPARRGTRWRALMEPVAAAVPLRGWVYLSWADRLAVHALAPAENLARLAAWRGLPGQPMDARQMLELSALPAWELRRPRRWDALSDALEALSATLRG